MSRRLARRIVAALLLAVPFTADPPSIRAAEPASACTAPNCTAAPEAQVQAAAAALTPHTWPAGMVIFQQTATEKRIREALELPATFDFLETPLEDVVEHVRNAHDVPILLDVASLPDPDVVLTKTLQHTTLANSLFLLLDEHDLCYVVKRDTLLITSKHSAGLLKNSSTRIYQVHDLITAPNDPTAKQPDFASLIEIVTLAIRAEDWTDVGGTIGVVKPFTGPGLLALVITHDEQGHREIEQLFQSLRAAKLPSIAAVQTRQPLVLRAARKVAQSSMGSFCPVGEPDQNRNASAK